MGRWRCRGARTSTARLIVRGLATLDVMGLREDISVAGVGRRATDSENQCWGADRGLLVEEMLELSGIHVGFSWRL